MVHKLVSRLDSALPLALTGLFVLVQQAAAWQPAPPDARAPNGESYAGIWPYDKTGHAGLAYPENGIPSTIVLDFVGLNSVSSDSYSIFFGSQYPSGTPFVWEVSTMVPGIECVLGVGAVNSWYYPAMLYPNVTLVPIDDPAVVLELEQVNDNCANCADFIIYPQMASSWEFPSVSTTVDVEPHIFSREMRVTATYLRGNDLEELGSEVKVFPSAITDPEAFECRIRAIWGDSSGPPSFPHHADFSPQIPEGPVIMSVWIDGFTTDSITLDLLSAYTYRWKPVLIPDYTSENPAVPPEDIFPTYYPHTFSREFTQLIDMPRLLNGRCVAAKHPGRPFDPNKDGIRDAADVLFTEGVVQFIEGGQ